MHLTRRDFLAATAAATTARAAWAAGSVRHLLATAGHNRLLLKAGFITPLAKPPRLRCGARVLEGTRSDTAGLFWQFDVPGLNPRSSYQLHLADAGGRPLCDPWPLSTLPHPGARESRLRLLVYTCAGGHEGLRIPGTNDPYFVPLAQRRRLLEIGLAQRPDAVIAIGDHIYWDLRSPQGSRHLGGSAFARDLIAGFDRTIPVLGTPNEDKLKKVVTPQIADLYGTLFRSVPVFFVQDDHDHFENDEATPAMVTFPPDHFSLGLARATQRLYYPEFLPDQNRPTGLPGASAADRAPGVSESYGTLRCGDLVEILIYDCRRNLSLTGPTAGFVPEVTEAWLTARMTSKDVRHLVNLPSTPVGWSAGKWGEWYPDLLLEKGKIGTAKPKYFWQEGWKSQHDRLLAAASAMERIPLFLSGDLHALAHGRIRASGSLNLRRNPITTILVGPISTGPRGWPSSARGTPPLVPTAIDNDQKLAPIEKNGFSIIDFTPDHIDLKMYRWKLDEPSSRLDDLQPFYNARITRTV